MLRVGFCTKENDPDHSCKVSTWPNRDLAGSDSWPESSWPGQNVYGPDLMQMWARPNQGRSTLGLPSSVMKKSSSVKQGSDRRRSSARPTTRPELLPMHPPCWSMCELGNRVHGLALLLATAACCCHSYLLLLSLLLIAVAWEIHWPAMEACRLVPSKILADSELNQTKQ